MRLPLIAAALCLASAASATEHNQPANITMTCNPHGAVVETAEGTTYYLGKQCDAARKGGGTGKWWYAASAFIVEIDGQSVRFAQEIPCDIPYCLP